MTICHACGQTVKPTALDKRANRRAKESDFEPGRCRTCNTTILVGWTGGTLTLLDHHPLSPLGVLAARTLKLTIYQRADARFRLYPTTPGHQPHPPREQSLHLRHECERKWEPELFEPLARHKSQQPNKPTIQHNPPF